eukprot:gene8666-613_t
MNTELLETLNNLNERLHKGEFFALLFWNHSFIIANIVYSCLQDSKKKEDPPLLVAILTMLTLGLGGAIINSFLMGKPQIFFDDDLILGAFFVAWVLVCYFPFGIVRFLTGNFVVEFLSHIPQGFFVGTVIIGAVDTAMKVYPHSNFAPVIIGTIGGCGGGILLPYVLAQYHSLKDYHTELQNPTLGTILPFILALFYFLSQKLGYSDVYGFKPIYIVELGSIFLFLYFWAMKWVAPLLVAAEKKEAKKESAPKKEAKKKETKKNK